MAIYNSEYCAVVEYHNENSDIAEYNDESSVAVE